MDLDVLFVRLVSLGNVFQHVLTMTVAASIIIAVFLLATRVLKKAPKGFTYILWLAVVARLLCPFTIDLPITIIPEFINDGKWVEMISEMDLIYDTKELADAPKLWFDSVRTEDGFVFGTRMNGMAPALKVGDTILPILFVVWVIGVIIVLVKSLRQNGKNVNSEHEKGNNWFEKLLLFFAFIGKVLHWFNPLVSIFYKSMKEDITAWKQKDNESDKSAKTMAKGIVVVAVVVLIALIGKNSVVKTFETEVEFNKEGLSGSISYESNETFHVTVKNDTGSTLTLSPSVYLFKWECGQWKQMEFELPENYVVQAYTQGVPAGEECDAFHLDFCDTIELEVGKYMLVVPVYSSGGGEATDALEAEFQIK